MSKESFLNSEQKAEKEKTKEELFEEFKDSLKKYKIEGANVEIEEGNLKIEQECGKGIRGIGYDGKIWMRLDQGKEVENNPAANEFQYNENTLASLESKFPGVAFEKKEEGMILVQLDSSHPAVTMAELLGNKEVQLRGINGWGDVDPFKFNKENGKWESELKWTGKFKECKIMIRDTEYKEGKKVTKPIKTKWNGSFGEGAEQIMKIQLEQEQELEK